MPWHPVPFRAASVYLRYGFLDLQSADFFRFFIRNLRLALVGLFAFINEEYLIALVDFKETAFGLWGLFWFHQE